MYINVTYPEMEDRYYMSPCGRTIKIEEESDEAEAAKVDRALQAFAESGALPTACYDAGRFLDLRKAVRDNYEILWTSITPPMERLLYAINAVKQPKNVLCLGIFCGNTLTWNVGAACGPGKCYDADRLTGVEIDKDPAALARRNLDKIGMERVAVLARDGFDIIDSVDYSIDLLYLDANGYDPEIKKPNTKRIYFSMLKRALPKLAPGAVVIAHDTIIPGFYEQAGVYLEFVRNDSSFACSFSVEIDEQGLEVTFVK